MTDPNVSLVPMRPAQSRTAKIAFASLAALGILTVLAEIGLHIASVLTDRTYELKHVVLVIGAIFGFVGFYGLDPKRTRDGGAFLVDQAGKLLPRFGRRSSDAIAVPGVETTVTALPTDQANPVTPPDPMTPPPTDLPTRRDD